MKLSVKKSQKYNKIWKNEDVFHQSKSELF
jgi:hypothetical protein